MKARIIEIYQLEGLYRIVDAQVLDLVSEADAHVRLTNEAEDAELHLRRRRAYGTMLATTFGVGAIHGSAKERFEIALARQKQPLWQGDGMLLITEVVLEIQSPSLQHITDFGAFAFTLTLSPIDEETLIQKVAQLRSAAVASLALAGFEQATHGGKPLGNAIMLLEPETGRPIYAVAPRISFSATSVHALLPDQALEATTFTRALVGAQKGLRNVPRLLASSYETRDDPLRSFVAAWTGLELLISASFGAYEPGLRASVRGAVLGSGGVALDRMFEVMKDKYRLLDKFAVVAGALAPDTSEADIGRFSAVKKARDIFFHTMSGDLNALPTHDAQSLLRKYLRLHLGSAA